MTEITGNRCGHNPTTPKTMDHLIRKKIPFLERVQCRMVDFYHKPADYLKRLALINLNHQQRSERREAIMATAQTLIAFTDLNTLAVGTYAPNARVRTIQYQFMCQETGFSLKRHQRALNDLAQAHYIKKRWQVIKVKSKEGFKFITVQVIKILPSFFIGLKFSYAYLQREQTRTHTKRAKAEEFERKRPLTEAERSRGISHVSVIKDLLKNGARRAKRANALTGALYSR